MRYIIDASAVLALLNDEMGGAEVERYLDDAAISAVNVVEVGTRLIDAGMTAEAAAQTLQLLGLPVVAFDAGLADAAIGLRGETREFGLSLGDRACIALAVQEGATAVTADRIWSEVTLACPIAMIR